MRFIGSKRLLLKNIDYAIQQNIKNYNKLKSFCDIFSGTTIVSQYFKNKYQIISNDLLYFSYCLQKSYIELNKKPKFINLNIATNLEQYLNNIDATKKGFIYKNYSPGGKDKRKYLSETNAKKIDTLRTLCDHWVKKNKINNNEYFYLISLIIEATPFVSNIAGTYGAYLKNWDKRSFKKINLNPIKIIDNKKKNRCFNEDCNILIKKISGDILYLDPPYNSRQYLPNYHLLETIAKYDNPKIKGKTGIREYENQKSNFCNKSFAGDSLEELIKNSNFRYIILSYNSEGIINEKKLEKIMKKHSHNLFKKYKFDYRRYKKDKMIKKDKLYELIYIIDKK
jgi:adenine-specific DNA-methyltransferase